jgi:GT2 family glycosyltransferase
MPKFSIIIPVCGNEKLTDNCLDSVKENSSDFEVIVVDNGSEVVRQGWWIVLRNQKNLGFPVAVNQGIKASAGEIIVILNNDTIVTPGWLEKFKYHLKTFGMVGPVSNRVSGPQCIPAENLRDKEAIYSTADLVAAEKRGRAYPWHRLVFFCVAIKREVVDKIGLLDEQFSPGNFEDDDYCLRAIEAGFKMGVAEDIFIYHVGSATHHSLLLDHKKLLYTNRMKFLAKWPAPKYRELKDKNNLKLHKI